MNEPTTLAIDPPPGTPGEPAPGEPTPATPTPRDRVASRVVAFDVARALAFFGMVVVNYGLVMGGFGGGEPEWISQAIRVTTGRSASLFVVLAGVGLTLFLAAQRRTETTERTAPRLATLRPIVLVAVMFVALVAVDFYVSEAAADRRVRFGPLSETMSFSRGTPPNLGEQWSAYWGTLRSGALSPFLMTGSGVLTALLAVFLIWGNQFRGARGQLIKRSLFLGAIGYAWLPLWMGDILHYYAFYLLLGTVVLTLRGRWILLLGTAVAIGTAWWTLRSGASDPFSSGTTVWSLEGAFRNLAVGGFHPLLPWLCFLFLGVFIGRIDVHRWRNKIAILVVGLGLATLSYTTTEPVRAWLRADVVEQHVPVETEVVIAQAEEKEEADPFARWRGRGGRGGDGARARGSRSEGRERERAGERGSGWGGLGRLLNRERKPLPLDLPDGFDTASRPEFMKGVEALRTRLANEGSWTERRLRVTEYEHDGRTADALVLAVSYGEKGAPADHDRQLGRLKSRLERWVRVRGQEEEPATAEPALANAAGEAAVVPATFDTDGETPNEAPNEATAERGSGDRDRANARSAGRGRWGRRTEPWPEAVKFIGIERSLPTQSEADVVEVTRWDTSWIDVEANRNPPFKRQLASITSLSSTGGGLYYVSCAMGTALSVIGLCLILASFACMQKLLWPLVLTGQMALTLYVAHVLVGFTLANQIELLNGGGLKFVAFYIGMCWVGSVAFACAWRSFFKRGPLEAVMRWMTA